MIVSLFLAFIVTSLLHRAQVEQIVQDNLIANGKKIIQSYQSTPSADLVPFMSGVAGISGNAVQIFDDQGKAILVKEERPVQVDSGYVRNVLAGGIVRNVENREHLPIVGIPFQAGGKPYALFVMLKTNTLWDEINHALHTVVLFVLIFGSLLILAAARYIVKPLVRLTDATKRMAIGNFDVDIRTRRKDEIGQLTASFNEMARDLSKLELMRREFVASVSHEIQTPLTSITGFTKALKEKTLSEESRQHYLAIIEEESGRLSRLSRNLLHLSSLQNENRPVNVTAYRLDEQLRKVVIALEPQWRAKEIEVDLQLVPVTIHADEDQLNQIWTNLLGNSIKFTPEGGHIRIGNMQEELEAVVAIQDNGIGIPEEERTDIFKPFHTVDKSRERSKSGNGLGLSIVRQIVDIHHGSIAVSGEPGQGTVFTVRLPLRQEGL